MHLQGWLWKYITHGGWYAIKQKKKNEYENEEMAEQENHFFYSIFFR